MIVLAIPWYLWTAYAVAVLFAVEYFGTKVIRRVNG